MALVTRRARPHVSIDFVVFVVGFRLAVFVAVRAAKRALSARRRVAIGALQHAVRPAVDGEGVIEHCAFPHDG